VKNGQYVLVESISIVTCYGAVSYTR